MTLADSALEFEFTNLANVRTRWQMMPASVWPAMVGAFLGEGALFVYPIDYPGRILTMSDSN